MGSEENVELINGAIVERKSGRAAYGKLPKWLSHLIDIYAQERKLGEAFGLRSAMKI